MAVRQGKRGRPPPLAISIPDGQEEILARVVAMTDSEYSDLLTALQSEPASISLDDLSRRVAARANRDFQETSDLLVTLAFAYAAIDRQADSTDQFVDALFEKLGKRHSDDIKDIELTKARKRFSDLFSLHTSLGMSAKAIDIVRETERLYCRGRIISDVRPVFLANATEAAAAVILHSLRISYHLGPGPEMGYFFVTLETEDLKELEKIIKRALSKDADIRSRSGIPCLPYRVSKE